MVSSLTHGLIEVDADAREDFEQLRMSADAGAASGQVIGIALEYADIPARAAQEMSGEQSAQRAADDHRPSRAHLM